MTEPCCLPVGAWQTCSSHIFITTRLFLITVRIPSSPGQVVFAVGTSVASTTEVRRRPTWYLRSTSLISLKLGDRMPGSNHFHTCSQCFQNFPIYQGRLLCLQYHLVTVSELSSVQASEAPERGGKRMGRVGSNRVSPLYPATLK